MNNIKVYFILHLYCTKLFSMWPYYCAAFSAQSNTSAIYGVITGTEVKVVRYLQRDQRHLTSNIVTVDKVR